MKSLNFLNVKVSSLRLTIIVALIFATIFNARIWQIYLANEAVETISDVLPMLFFFIFLFCLLFSIFSIFSFRGLQKIALTGFFIISAIALYFSMNFKVLFDESMIQNVLETDVNEASELLTSSFGIMLFFMGIVPSIIIVKLKINYRNFLRQFLTNSVFVFAGLALSVLSLYPYYGEFSSFIRNNNKKLAYSLLPSAPIYALYKNLKHQSHEQRIVKTIIDVNANIHHSLNYQHAKPMVLVVIVGETARASSFVAINTNNFNQKNNLSARSDVIYLSNFWSCGTNTALSVPCMFSLFSKEDYKREYNKTYENIAEIIQRVGYDVTWRENDGGCKGVCKRLHILPVTLSNSKKFFHDNEFYDEALVKNLETEIVKNTNDQVIFLHQNGSHGPAYYKRIPEKFKISQPACESANFRDCTDIQIKNAYNNTILYTKYIVEEAIENLEMISDRYDTALLYMSDHGESTGENGYYLHGVPEFMAPDEQTHIPALIWLSDGFTSSKDIDLGCLRNRSSEHFSHDNLSHTLMGLLEIESEAYLPELDILNGCNMQTVIAQTKILSSQKKLSYNF